MINSIYLNIIDLSVCWLDYNYQINVKTSEPIRPNFFVWDLRKGLLAVEIHQFKQKIRLSYLYSKYCIVYTLPSYCSLDVCEELFISSHHFIIVIQPEVYLDHLLQGLEPPLTLLTVLQVQNTLETLQSSLNRYNYRCTDTDTDTDTDTGTGIGT